MGSTGSSQDVLFGKIKSIRNKSTDKINKNINPNYGNGQEYSNNCALCSTVSELRHRGFLDLQAGPRDSTWRGAVDVFDISNLNPQDYIIGKSTWTHYQHLVNNAVNISNNNTSRLINNITNTMNT